MGGETAGSPDSSPIGAAEPQEDILFWGSASLIALLCLTAHLSVLMISKGLADPSVPMSLLADHPNVRFNYYRHGIGSVATEMH